MSAKEWMVDLQWEPFNKQMGDFLQALDLYTKDMMGKLTAVANGHTNQMKTFAQEKAELEAGVALEKEKEKQLLMTMEQERTAVMELQSSLSKLNISLDRSKEKIAAHDQEIKHVKHELNTIQTSKDRQKNTLNTLSSQDEPELTELERLLGLHTISTKNRLRFEFTQIDPENPEKPHIVVLDYSSAPYKVLACEPVLPEIQNLTSRLSEDGNVAGFLKRVRQAFRALVPSEDSGAMFGSIGARPSARSSQMSRSASAAGTD